MDNILHKKIYYFGIHEADHEVLGITPDNRYVYCGHIGMPHALELLEISHEMYRRFAEASFIYDLELLEQLRKDIYADSSVAFEASQHEPIPRLLPSHDSEISNEYDDFITINLVISAEYTNGVLILETSDGETKEFEINIPI